MPNPIQFSKNIRRRSTQVLVGAQQMMRLATVRATSVVARETPVDTGFARSNWVVSIGGADLSPRSIRSLQSVVGEAQATAARIGLTDVVRIANGGAKVPYLAGLNDGNSQQVPEGFLKTATLEGVAIIRGFRVLKS